MHKTALATMMLALLLASPALAAPVEPGARVLLSVARGSAESPFGASARPSPGVALVVHSTSALEGPVVVVAFTPSGSLANGWSPQSSAIPRAWANAPAVRLPWSGTDHFDLYVVLCGHDPAALDLARRAAAVSTTDAGLARLQSRQLQQGLQAWSASHSLVGVQGGTVTHSVGGLKRSAIRSDSNWRHDATAVPLDGNGAGVIVFRYRP